MNYGGNPPNIVGLKVTTNSSYPDISYYWGNSSTGNAYNASKGIIYYPSSGIERVEIFLANEGAELKYVVILQEEPVYPSPDDPVVPEPEPEEEPAVEDPV